MGLFDGIKSEDRSRPEAGAFGPFRLHELINSGGMADLWLASNQKEEPCALRLMHRHLRYDFTAKRRFVRGCEILSKIHNHEQVIGYYSHGKINGYLYLQMEYVEGGNMRELFNRSDPILVDNVWSILDDMAQALLHVHDSGFMHLDFKPENLILTRNGQLRLIDFDLALPRPKQPEKLWKYAGTPAYMSPERLLHQAVDHRADIFAWGVVAYELVTRSRPFIGDTTEEIVRKQTDWSHDYVPPRERNPDLSVGVEKVIVRCLERDPEKRYPDMSFLLQDLRTAA
jgi:serine/threonine-protein kinase